MSRWVTQKVLDAMPPGRKTTTTSELARKSGLTAHQVRVCVAKLKKRDLLASRRPGVHRLTAAGHKVRDAGLKILPGPNGKVPYRRGTFRERLWRILRQQVKTTIPELIELAGTGREKDPDKNAAKYLWALAQAGYVVKMARREPGIAPSSIGYVRYVLIRDTGPKPPTFRERLYSVFDQNTGEEHRIERAPEGAPA